MDGPASYHDMQKLVLAEGRIMWRSKYDRINDVKDRPPLVFTDVKNYLAYPQTGNNLPGCQGGGLALYV
jgi:hypothetical protein